MKKESSPINILMVGRASDCEEIGRVLSESNIRHRVTRVDGSEKAKALLGKRKVTVVLCHHDLEDGTWQAVLGHAQEAGSKPSVVVCGRLADERLWAEVLNRGGFDVLSVGPPNHEEFVRVIESAHQHCPLIQLGGKAS